MGHSMTDTTHDRRRHGRRYSPLRQRRLHDRAFRLRYGPFEPSERSATWSTIADVLRVDRKTLWRWRQDAQWQTAETAYRALLRTEARTDAAGMAQEAVAHLGYLMGNARSQYIQLQAAITLLELSVTGEEPDEVPADGDLVATLLALRDARAARTTPSDGPPEDLPPVGVPVQEATLPVIPAVLGTDPTAAFRTRRPW